LQVIQRWISSIQHNYLTPYRFVVDLSQMDSTRLTRDLSSYTIYTLLGSSRASWLRLRLEQGTIQISLYCARIAQLRELANTMLTYEIANLCES